jgi:putative transcriptional regulator
MPIMHHADASTLMSYAAGTLPEVLSAVVASHLALCPVCRQEFAVLELLGGVMMDGLPHTSLQTLTPKLSSQLEITTDEGDHVLAAIEHAGDVPAPLSRIVGSDLSSIQWKRLGFGVWHKSLPLSAGAKGDLRLIKVAPGQGMPEHGHGGSELTLILAGSYTDKIGRFETGDMADLDENVEHMPIADHQTGCICLVASEGPARFKGLFARIVQPYFGL